MIYNSIIVILLIVDSKFSEKLLLVRKGKMEINKLRILYIHGFNSGKNSETGKFIKEFFKEAEFFSEDFDLRKRIATVEKIQFLVEKYNINTLIGSSLGGFYVLICNNLPQIKYRIAINPCMFPSLVIPKFDPNAPQSHTDETIAFEKSFYSQTEKNLKDGKNIYGIFGAADEYFHHKVDFENLFGNSAFFDSENLSNSVLIENAKHHLTKEQLFQALPQAIKYLSKL